MASLSVGGSSQLSTREKVEDCFDFNFLKDELTVNYFKKSKIVFILRRSPGSGNSALCNALKETYPESIVCIADHYYLKDGKYCYDATKSSVKYAHNLCHRRTVAAVKKQINVIIIDNANVKLWEIKFYLTIAKEFNYIPVVVESKYVSEGNVNVLLEKNILNVSKILKSRNYENIIPLCFGWFLNEKDSYLIHLESQNWFQKAFDIEDFRKDVHSFTGCRDMEDIQLFFAKPRGDVMLHCTAKFFSVNERKYYTTTEEVLLDAMGEHFIVEIIGFFLTPRTMGARVKLTPKQKTLWFQNDIENIPPEFSLVTPKQFEDDVVSPTKKRKLFHPEKKYRKKSKQMPKYSLSVDSIVAEQTLTKTNLEQDRFEPISGKGSRAHLTLAVAPGVIPSTTGLDTLFVNNLEAASVPTNDNSQMSQDSSICHKTFTLNGASLKNYGCGVWVVYLEKNLLVGSVFIMKPSY